MSLHLVTGYAGQAHIKAANHGAYNAAVVGSGKYVLDSGNMMAASVLSANKIRIYDGICLNQGRHIQIDPDTYEEVDIENGTQGYMRNDIIVMRYSKDAETDIETPSLVVIKGTPAEVSPADPEHAEGSILNGALVDDMPLYRVPLDGLTVGELVPLFDIKPSLDNMLVSDLDEMSAITEAGKYAADAKVVGALMSHVGMIIHSTTLDTEEKVKAIYGGASWAKIEGRFLLGQSDSYAVNTVGGEATHKLTVNEMPSHNHSGKISARGSYLAFYNDGTAGSSGTASYNSTGDTFTLTSNGGNQAHNNMPPYKTVYIWERVA